MIFFKFAQLIFLTVMHDYISLRIDTTPYNETITDLLAAFLADDGYETFEPDERGLTAYVRKDNYDKKVVEEIIRTFPISCDLKFSAKEIKGEDWNKEWEQNYFQPIMIDEKLVIRSSFHKNYPKGLMEIIIDPKMAFGTGHHSTTAGMSTLLMEEDLKDKSVIDMGTGTGILAILSKKLGAGKTIGIDIDEFAVENAEENGCNNSVEIDFMTGDDKALDELEATDIFLANINLNVIISNLEKYIEKLKPGGKILLSGFLTEDREKIIAASERYGLKLLKEREEKNWLTMKFAKLLDD